MEEEGEIDLRVVGDGSGDGVAHDDDKSQVGGGHVVHS